MRGTGEGPPETPLLRSPSFRALRTLKLDQQLHF